MVYLVSSSVPVPGPGTSTWQKYKWYCTWYRYTGCTHTCFCPGNYYALLLLLLLKAKESSKGVDYTTTMSKTSRDSFIRYALLTIYRVFAFYGLALPRRCRIFYEFSVHCLLLERQSPLISLMDLGHFVTKCSHIIQGDFSVSRCISKIVHKLCHR